MYTLHYITLHYVTLHYITLRYVTLRYITLHYVTFTIAFFSCRPSRPRPGPGHPATRPPGHPASLPPGNPATRPASGSRAGQPNRVFLVMPRHHVVCYATRYCYWLKNRVFPCCYATRSSYAPTDRLAAMLLAQNLHVRADLPLGR